MFELPILPASLFHLNNYDRATRPAFHLRTLCAVAHGRLVCAPEEIDFGVFRFWCAWKSLGCVF
jgi:hypothetical protein